MIKKKCDVAVLLFWAVHRFHCANCHPLSLTSVFDDIYALRVFEMMGKINQIDSFTTPTLSHLLYLHHLFIIYLFIVFELHR